jgi:hypothetical protein
VFDPIVIAARKVHDAVRQADASPSR